MNPTEVALLDRTAPGGLTKNPDTGLPEAFGLSDLAGAALSILAPSVGSGISDWSGLSDIIGGTAGSALANAGIGAAIPALLGGKGSDALIGALGGGLGSLAAPYLKDGFSGIQGLLGLSGGAASGAGSVVSPGVDSVIAGLRNGVAPAATEAASSGGSWLSRNLPLLAIGTMALGGAGGSKAQTGTANKQAATDQQAKNNQPPPQYVFNRTQLTGADAPPSWYRLGTQNTGQPLQFFDNASGTYTQKMAAGGHVQGPGGGQDDAIPARLSDGEYVMDATTVADLGDGSTPKGAAVLDRVRDAIAKDKGRKSRVPPKVGALESYIQEAKRGTH
ncbi:MAG: hypothetical protein NTX56_04540 [Proteobacteria bacterium]|nr:hypothetical protein [Pseudomonadota bacterium]